MKTALFKHVLTISNRTLKLGLEIMLVLVVLAAIGIGAFMWRLSQGPISAAFAKDYIEEALSSETEHFSVKFDDIVFSWPDLTGHFQLDVTGLRLQKGDDETASALTIDDASIGLSRRALFFGRIRPVSVVLKSPSVELVRGADGHIELFLENSEITEAAPQENAKPAEVQIAELFKGMSTRRRGGGTFLSRLNEFVIDDASVAVRDQQYGLSWYLTDLDFRIEEADQGTAASLIVDLPGGRDREASININMVYRKDSDDFRAAASFENINPAFISRFLTVPDELQGQDLFFSGDVEAAADTNMHVTAAQFHGIIPKGVISLPDQYDAPVTVSDIVIDSEFDGEKDMLSISELSGSIGGIAFEGQGRADFSADEFSIPVTLKVGMANLADVPKLFPKSEWDGEAYKWLAQDLTGGTFSDVVLNMELAGIKTRNEAEARDIWDVDVPKMTLDFAFEGVKVNYSDELMPAENAKGTGHLDLATGVLEIKGESATLGGMTGSDIDVKVTDLMKAGAGYVTVKAHVKGPMATALEYIASPTIGMDKDEIGIDYKSVKGDADLLIEVGLPTLKDIPKEAVDVDVAGTLNDVSIPGLVEGLTLSGGPMSIATEAGGFRIKGDGSLEGRAAKFEWHQNFDSKGKDYSMQVKASIGADQQLRNHFGVDLDEYISGTMPVDVVYTLKDGNAKIDVKGDLNPVRLYIDPFKFEKPMGLPGSVTATATLKNNVLTEITGLNITSKGINVANAKLGFAPMNGKSADIASGTLPDVTLGATKLSANFAVKNNVMTITAKGPVFDARPFLRETESSDIGVKAAVQTPKEKVQPMMITLNADEMLAENGQMVRAARTYLEMDDEGDITGLEYDAAVGQGSINIRFRPDETGKRIFRLNTNDAGKALYAAGLYENVHGGTLIIYGEPQGGDLRGDLYGSMRMENFRVVKAPALASLLSLMSLGGVRDLLGNEGIVFSKLESDFEWRFRPDGNVLVIKDGKTSGSSVGLTFGGNINRGTKMTDISGTIIPMTEINSIIGSIPIIGNLLGGDTGLIAATYTMRGPTSDPRVAVNPLSVLAPGFLRNILFEGGFKTNIPGVDERKEPAPVAPKPQSGLNR